MRIAIVATSYPVTPHDPSGHFVRAEARSFASAGHEVHVIAPNPFGGDEGITTHASSGASLFAWPGAAQRARENPLRLASAPLFGIRASRHLSRLHPDEIVAHWLVPSAYPISLARGAARLESVCHGADVRLLLALPTAMREHVLRSAIANGGRIRLVSTMLRERLLASCAPALARLVADASSVRPPAVDVSQASAPPASTRPYAVCAARFVPEKRVALSIDAIQGAKAPLDLVVIGDGPATPSLAAANSSRVKLLGRLDRHETLGWMRGATMLLHTSSVDSAPTVVLEARALGVPVVSCGAGDVARWAETDPGIKLTRPRAADVARAVDEVFFGEGI